MGFLQTYKLWLYGAIVLVFVALLGYCKYLRTENHHLEIENDRLTQAYDAQKKAAQLCSENTLALKKREDELTENAKVAVEVAKKEANENRQTASDILFRKPKTPTITKENVKDYGGENKEVQLTDYLQTQDLLNSYLAIRS